MGNTSGKSSDRRNLPSSTKNVGSGPGHTTRKYVDKDGYTVVESISPTGKTVIKYSKTKNDITVIVNTESVYHSSYNPEYLKILERQLLTYEKAIDYQMARLDQDLFDLDAFLSDDSFFESIGTTYSSPSSLMHSSTKSSKQYSNSSKGSGYSLGCLFWSIIAILVVCLIVFSMGAIGKAIIDFLASLF